MPYLVISCEIRTETGPTICGGDHSDKKLMEALSAKLTKKLGNNFSEYMSPHAPEIILNMLEQHGYYVVTSSGVGQTHVWTLHSKKPGA